MTQPTPTQWERFSTLRLRLEPLADEERREALHAVRSENGDDADVVSLLALHFAMPETTTEGIGSGDRIDDFVLGERLGAGGMGVVYEATQSLGDASRSVAIKLINPLLWSMAPEQTRERFADEIKAQAALQYNGLARLYAAGSYEDPATHTQAPYLVMELVHGALPITDYARERSLDVNEKLQLFQRICRALQHAHDHRIIHRDLKPDNILIDSEGRPFVVDFGLAQTADAVLPGASMVTSGTIAYMSPEQLSPEFGPISEKTDSYALGVVLYELLTGSKPYETSLKDSLEQLTKVITADPPKRPRGDVDTELENIVMMALSKKPVDRPSVGTLGSQLDHFLSRNSRSSADNTDSSAAGGTMWSELRRRGGVLVAVVAVALGIFGYSLFTGDTKTEQVTSAANTQPVAERPRGIAVLPFDNLSADPSNAYFAGGMHDEVLSRIARIPDLRVISRTSMVSVGKLGLDVGAIAERLNVSHVLEGSVRRDGERVRITVQLIDPAIDEPLWSESFNETVDDVFGIQSQIALAIAAQLEAKLAQATAARIAEVPTTNRQAHDLYLQALAEKDIYRASEGYLAMKPLLEKAVALDPDFLQAQVLLVETYGRLLWTGADPDRIYGAKALELVSDIRRRWPDRPEGLVALAHYHYTVELDYESAKAMYLEALSELPNDTFVIDGLSGSFKRLHQFRESLRYARKLIELDPESQFAHSELGIVLAYDGQPDEALAHYEQALDRFPDSAAIRSFYAGLLLSHRGDVDAFLAQFEKLERHGDSCAIGMVEVNSSVARVLYARGDVAASLAHVEVCSEATEGWERVMYWDDLSITLHLEGRDAEARQVANRAMKFIQQDRLDNGRSLPSNHDRSEFAQVAYHAARVEDWDVYRNYRDRWSDALMLDFINDLYSSVFIAYADAIAGDPDVGWVRMEAVIHQIPFYSRNTIVAQLPHWNYFFGEAAGFQAFIKGTEADADE